jgi:hypothetical protein
MSKRQKLLNKILSGGNDIRFDEMCDLLKYMGFEWRNNGSSHFIFRKAGLSELIDIQEANGGMCKTYQIRQIKILFEKEGIRYV